MHLTKVSLALLSAVFLLGCQEQGSGPVGLEGPQFDKKGTPGDPCPGGGVRDGTGHCHGDDGDGSGDPRFTVTMEGDILAGEHEGVRRKNNILMDLFYTVDFTSLREQLTCGDPNFPITEPQTANQNSVFLGVFGGHGDGSDGHFGFSFTHNGIGHGLVLDGTIENPPNSPTSNIIMTARPGNGNGRWSVAPGGRNHKDGCTGEGGGGSSRG